MKNVSLITLAFLLNFAGLVQAQSFHKTKMIDAKGKEVPVELVFSHEGQHFTVKSLNATVADVPYASIDKLSYEKAARHRVKEGAVVMLGSLGVGAAVMLTKSKKHWFYVDYKGTDGATKSITLKLDKREYQQVLAAAKDQTGRQVEELPGQNANASGTSGGGHNLELRLVGGTALGQAMIDSPSPNGGVEVAFRFNRVVALTWNYHHIGTSFCFSWEKCTQSTGKQINHEIMGGIHLSVPNRSRITSYVTLTAGGVNYTYGSTSYANPGVAVGAGVDCRLSPRFGITTEAHRIVPILIFGGQTFPSYGRTDAGVYFRF